MTRRKKIFPFFLWHRRLGLVALLLVFILSITGIMLNHNYSLKLDKTLIESDLILKWYGIKPQGNAINFKVDNIWISQWDQQLFFNGHSFFTHEERLNGISLHGDIISIALEHHVLLVDINGEVIELIPVNTTSPIKHIASFENRVALIDSQGSFYLSNLDISIWKSTNRIDIAWISPSDLTDFQLSILEQEYKGQALNLERVILDLHSGRIFNEKWGIYIMDASAILMMLLGISGLWIWWSRKLKMRSKKHYQKHH